MDFFQFLVTFFMESEYREHGSYLVDSLWGVPELRDWNSMTSLLLQEPGLQYEEEGALIELMICAIRRAAEAKPPAGREEGKKVLSKKDKENQVRDRMRITNHFIPVLPQLLAKYSADAKYVSRLLIAPLYFDLETSSSNVQLRRSLDLLLEPVCDIVRKHTEASVLEACASLFSSLCSEQNTFNACSKTAISCLLDFLTDQFKPLARNLLEGTVDEDDMYGAATALTKIAGLSRSFNITGLQLLEYCLDLLKKGLKSADINKQLMVAALHTAAYHLFWIKSSSSAVISPQPQVKKLLKLLKSFYKVCERCLSRQAEIRNKAFELLCYVLVLYSGYVVRTQADLKMLSCSCPLDLQIEMSAFLVDFIFTDPADDEHADESEEGKLAAVQRKRNQLAGYCKLILFGVLDLKAASDVFKYYDKFYSDFGDIIKLFLDQTKQSIDPVESAKTVGFCLQEVCGWRFTESQFPENTGKEFNEIKGLAKRHAMSLGINLELIQEQVQALLKQGIHFAFCDIQKVVGGTQPPKLLFLEILSEFSSKVLRKNRTQIIAILDANFAEYSKTKTALSWPSVKMYRDSLNTSISSPAQTKGKRKRPTIPEPQGAPGSASGSEGSVTFPSMENVDGSEGGAYSSPLPSYLGEPCLSSTVIHTKPTQFLGLDKEDGNIVEPESDESPERVPTPPPSPAPSSHQAGEDNGQLILDKSRTSSSTTTTSSRANMTVKEAMLEKKKRAAQAVRKHRKKMRADPVLREEARRKDRERKRTAAAAKLRRGGRMGPLERVNYVDVPDLSIIEEEEEAGSEDMEEGNNSEVMEEGNNSDSGNMKRPQNRHYVFHKKSPYIQRAAKLSMEDLDEIFDSSYDDEDLIPPSPVEETEKTRAAQRPRGKVLQSAATSNIPDQNIVLNSPFKNRALFKTSSPIDNDDTGSDVQHDMGRISPIPFNVEEEEEPEKVLQKPTDLMHTFEVEPSPDMIAFKKNLAPLMKVAPPQKGNGHVPAVSVVSLEPQKKVPEKKSNGLKEKPAPSKKLVKPNEETGPGASKTLKESKMPAEIRREKPKQKNGDKLVSAPSREPQPPAQQNSSKIPTLSKKVAAPQVQGFISGPSSMIALEAYEDTCLPSSVIHSALSATELCVFPLAPVALQARDEENLTKWFSICWPAIVKTAPQMNTDVFRWFSYRYRMIGVCEDLLHDNWCVGKMILGSHAQKPLWVDHSATTVYNVLTSAVSVKIDGVVSQYNPGLSFAVPCGHAHSINNLTVEPAVLTFNRQRNQNAD